MGRFTTVLLDIDGTLVDSNDLHAKAWADALREHGHRSKPCPDIVQAALERAQEPADRVVLLGDTPYDIAAAAGAGVACMALRSGGWSDQELSGAIAIYDNLADLFERWQDSPLAT